MRVVEPQGEGPDDVRRRPLLGHTRWVTRFARETGRPWAETMKISWWLNIHEPPACVHFFLCRTVALLPCINGLVQGNLCRKRWKVTLNKPWVSCRWSLTPTLGRPSKRPRGSASQQIGIHNPDTTRLGRVATGQYMQIPCEN